LGCDNYRQECGCCKYLAVRSDNDLSHKIWKKKRSLYSKNNIRFVSCSEWLRNEVLGSKLMAQQQVVTIPNPIDTSCYYPCGKTASRQALGLPHDKKLLLFVAQGVNNPNKGMQYLIDAMQAIEDKNIALVMLGGRASQIIDALDGIPVYALGYVSDTETIRQVYSASDAFVLPSLSENLPNTIMEAMACGTPCVGFNVGGIPEMISHRQTGYVAEYRNADDLAAGIRYVLDEANTERLSQESLRKVREQYSEDVVASKYMELYSG
jgi:glycosyltransferase involved in cell wall biosynthesis